MSPILRLLGGTSLAAIMVTSAQSQSIIDNGLIALGVNEQGNLIVEGIGLTYIPTLGEALSPGCECEGWGVTDFGTDFFGKAGEDFGDANLFNASLVVSGTGTFGGSAGSSATSSVDVGDGDKRLNVSHAYAPSASSNLYQVDVSITNIGTESIVRLVYRRAMDWDVPPTEFSEFVTIQGTAATNLIFSSDDGFADGNPNSSTGSIVAGTENTDFVDSGPADHGAVFDFDFGGLAPGEIQTFTIFYGAAATEAEALAALGAVGAEVYSLGQPSTEGGETLGTPNTFIFAFAGVGGTPITPGGAGDPHGFLNTYRDVASLIMNSHRRVVGQFTTVDPGARIAVEQIAKMSDNGQVMSMDTTLGKIPLRVYGSLTGEFGNFDRKGASAGFDYTGGGIVVGADYQLPAAAVGGADVAIGASFGFQRIDADIDANAGSVDADGYSGSIYGYGAMPMGGMGQLHGEIGVTFGYLDYDQTRISGGQSFDGSPDGFAFAADLEVGYQFDKIRPFEDQTIGIQAGPFVGMGYGYNDVDSFQESGGGLQVSSFDDERLVTTFGGRVSLIKEAEANTYFGMLEASYNHDFLADGQSVGVNGGVLTSQLASPDDDSIGLRALGGLSLNDRLRVMLEYNGGFSQNSAQHAFLGRVDFAF